MNIQLQLASANVIAGKPLEKDTVYTVIKSDYSFTEKTMVVLVKVEGVDTNFEEVSFLTRVLFSTTEPLALLLDKREDLVFV